MGGACVRARVRPYAFEREEMTAVMAALGRRGVPAASRRAWRFVPEPEMRTVMRRVRGIVVASC